MKRALFIAAALIAMLVAGKNSDEPYKRPAVMTTKRFGLGPIANSFVVQKESLGEDAIISGVCAESDTTFSLSSSYLIKVCNLGCDPTDPESDLLFQNVQLYDTLSIVSSPTGTGVLDHVDVTALDLYTMNNSAVDTSGCSGLSMGMQTNTFSATCSLLVSANSSLLCPGASAPTTLVLQRNRNLDRLSSLFANVLGRAKMENKVLNPSLHHAGAAALGVDELLSSQHSLLGASQCTAIANVEACFVYKVTFFYNITIASNTDMSCPVFNLTNSVQANATHCVCNEERVIQKYGVKEGIVGQCGTNVSYCSVDSAISQSPLPVSNQSFTLNCVVSDNCNACASLTSSTCSFSQVVCTATFSNLGDTSISDVNYVINMITAENVTFINATSSLAQCDVDTTSAPGTITVAPCCLDSSQTEVVVVTYCIPRTDVNVTKSVQVSVGYNYPCGTNPPSINENTTFSIEAQNVCLGITKESLSGASIVCPNVTADFPVCIDYRLNVSVLCGCIDSTSAPIVDFIVDDLTDLLSPLLSGYVINIATNNPALVCAVFADNVLHCNLTGAVNASTTLTITYSVCFSNCLACTYIPIQPLFPLINTATVNYTAGINSVVQSTSLNTSLVCPCPECLCTINVSIADVQKLRLDTVYLGYPNAYYQGSECDIYNTTGGLLGTFVYGALTGTLDWYCTFPPSDSTNTPCACDKASTLLPHSLVCATVQNVTITCCAVNRQYPDGPIMGGIEFDVCNTLSNVTQNFTCAGNPMNFAPSDPSVTSILKNPAGADAAADQVKKKRGSFSCADPTPSGYNISFPLFQNSGSLPGIFTINAYSTDWMRNSTPTFTSSYFASSIDPQWIIPDPSDVSTISSTLIAPFGGISNLVFTWNATGSSTDNGLIISLTVTLSYPSLTPSSPPIYSITKVITSNSTCYSKPDVYE